MAVRYTVLSDADLENALFDLDGWEVKDGGLYREFRFKNFVEAFAFLTKVAISSEKLNHHPEIYNVYNKVIISGLKTHDADNRITSLDIELAREISKF